MMLFLQLLIFCHWQTFSRFLYSLSKHRSLGNLPRLPLHVPHMSCKKGLKHNVLTVLTMSRLSCYELQRWYHRSATNMCVQLK